MESRERLLQSFSCRKFLISFPPLLFRSFTALQFALSFISFFPSAPSLPIPPRPLICLSRFFSPLPILHPSSLHGPALSFPSSPLLSSFHPSLLMSLSISNCEASVAQGRGRAQAKLALTSTPPLPSGWESFNAPLESSSDLRSFLAPSLPLPPPHR